MTPGELIHLYLCEDLGCEECEIIYFEGGRASQKTEHETED